MHFFRRKFMISLVAFIFMVVVFSSNTLASSEINVRVYGEKINFANKPMEKNGRVLVPLRAVSEELGADIYWNEEKQKITLVKGNVQNELYINNPVASKFVMHTDFDAPELFTHTSSTLDVAPQTYNNSTYVPLRYIAESFGLEVGWNPKTSTVNLGLYTMAGSGAYSSMEVLKGHPLEHKYNLYFNRDTSGPNTSISFKYEDLNPINLNEKVKLTSNGKSYTVTKSELYNYFSDSLDFADVMEKLGDKRAVSKQLDSHDEVFGKYFDEWFNSQVEQDELYRYYMTYERQEEARNTVVTNMAENDFEKLASKIDKQNKEAKELDEIETNIGYLREQATDIWVDMLNDNYHLITDEWVSERDLSDKAGLTAVQSTDVYKTWQFYRDYKPIYKFSFTEAQFEQAKKEAVEVNGIRVKTYDGVNFHFNTKDLLTKNLVKQDQVKIVPSWEDYWKEELDSYLKIHYPGIDYKEPKQDAFPIDHNMP